MTAPDIIQGLLLTALPVLWLLNLIAEGPE
jgi:hypothetical protein